MTDEYEPEKPNGMWQKWTIIGTDGDGSEHVVDFVSRTVYVVTPDGNLEHTEYLEAKGASVEAWMKFVDDKRGWQERNYGRSVGEMLADSMEGAA